MGGGGALYAAGTLGMDVQAAVGLMEHSPGGTFSHIKAPTLLLAGSADSDGLGGPNAHSIPSYESLAADTVKMLAVVNGGDHFMGINGGMHHDIIGALALAWYQVHLNGDPRYQSYIDGADFDTIAAQFSEVRP